MHILSTILLSAVAAMAAPVAVAPAAPAAPADCKYPSNSTGTGAPGPQDHLPAKVAANQRSGDRDLITALMTAPTQKDRMNLLNQPGDTIFDFTNPPASAVAEGQGGRVVSANAGTFPALIGNGAALAVAFLHPCGLNSPHVHNRATELNVPVRGRLVTSFVEENGVAPREDLLDTFNMAVFPQGAAHAEFNPDCEEAVFVAAFSSADPGVEQIAQAFFSLRPDIVSASLNGVQSFRGEDIDTFRSMLPANVVAGVESCLARCGLKKNAKRDLKDVLVA